MWYGLSFLLACNGGKDVTNGNAFDGGEDLDGDGYFSDEDCNDNDPSSYPGAIEICDSVDNNCDEEIDEGVLVEYFADADSDGFGNNNLSIFTCSQPNGFVPNGNDCNDAEPNMYPGATEECDGLDNDCNDIIDDGNDIIVYLDADGDGYGNINVPDSSCTAGDGYVENALDCNDQNNTINPDANEVCDGIDNNCDALVDNDALDATIWYQDLDGDGHGNTEQTIVSCLVPAGFSGLQNDCDDTNPEIHPFAAEICDDIDQDCDGSIDEGTGTTFFADTDGDGYGNFHDSIESCTILQGYVTNAQDCNDTNPDISPDALEYCNGFDDNCDTIIDENTAEDVMTWYADVDGDGFGDEAVPFQACQAPAFYVDTIGDCDDDRSSVHPDATESCLTAYDDNCNENNNDDGALGCLEYFADTDGDGYGDASFSQCLCVVEGDFQSLADTDCDDSKIAVHPGILENCTTTYDDNCNGDTNEAGGSGCSYFYHDFDGDGFGTSDRMCLCEADGMYEAPEGGDCEDENALINPSKQEVCDDLNTDENCDGIADGADAVGAVDWYLDADADGYGDENQKKTQCDQPTEHTTIPGDCVDSMADINPGMNESCFTADDDDCSGTNNDPNALGCSDFFLDEDADGYGLASDTQCLCFAEVPYTSVESGDCDDTNDAVSPGKQETCDTPFDEDCDGVPDEVDALNCLIFHYDYDGDTYGIGSDSQCLCVDDGYYRADRGGDCLDTDVSVNPGEGNCGLVGTIPKEDSAIVISGIQEYDPFSYTQNFITNFDYNNDGILDIAVVDPGFDTQYTDAGALFIFLGPLDSSVDISNGLGADLMFSPSRSSEFLGRYSGISVGNWDSDAAYEIVVSGTTRSYLIDDNLQFQSQITDTNAGVTVFAGVNPGTSTQSYDEAMHMIGDVNNDGIMDVLRQEGSYTYLYTGDGSGGLNKTSFYYYQGITQSFNLNYTLEFAQRNKSMDTNSNGVLEWLGFSYLCDGTYATHQLCIREYDETIAGFTEHRIDDVTNHQFGRLAIGDVNGDGYEDIISSDYRRDYYDSLRGTLTQAGQVWVFYGSVNGITVNTATEADWTAYGDNYTTNSRLHFGAQIDVADINGDNIDDLLVGSAKGSFIFYGPLQTYVDSSQIPRDANSSDADAVFPHLGTGIRNAGDQNQDGFDDILIGGYCNIQNHTDTSLPGVCGVDLKNIYLFYGAEN